VSPKPLATIFARRSDARHGTLQPPATIARQVRAEAARSQRQRELPRMLDELREATLSATARERLDTLMAEYRLGLVRKAQAWREAVRRGLRAPLR
jgi:hypothetical protein